ncbi:MULTISPECIES: hypothetical protein [Acidobacteriaceae]|uniref:hypothetical protein n=1 Tax=Acidobacteriaceae TaxID=204434 RepID=UPI00131ACEAE|nr:MULTISPECIES: hypothetical protein [Acidobacteriaceae]MDW5264850.1 hypothetical protein [Edaphobacter sp.]
MRPLARTLATIAVFSAVTAFAQQPQFLHARLTTTAAHGLNAELNSLKDEAAPLWVGYSVPVVEKSFSGQYPRISYLEGDHPNVKDDEGDSGNHSYDHAVILFRIVNHGIEKIHVDNPGRQIDAGDLRVVWLTNVTPDESIANLKSLALQNDSRKLRDVAVFAISIHQSPATGPRLSASRLLGTISISARKPRSGLPASIATRASLRCSTLPARTPTQPFARSLPSTSPSPKTPVRLQN